MLVQEKNNKGLSLLELIVVLSIVGILSAVAYPNFSSWYKEREVRQAAVKIHALMKNIAIQTEKGTFGYVQVLFSNDDDNLIVSSKGLTMQTLSTKINDGTDPWNTDMSGESRCNVTDTNYWDTDLATTSSELKNSVYSITLSDVTTNFEGIGAICFSRNGKFCGGFVPQSQDDVKWLLDIGMKFITYEVDNSMIFSNYRRIGDWFQEEADK